MTWLASAAAADAAGPAAGTAALRHLGSAGVLARWCESVSLSRRPYANSASK